MLLVSVTIAVSRLKPAAPEGQRSTVCTDAVKRGSMLRQVRDLTYRKYKNRFRFSREISPEAIEAIREHQVWQKMRNERMGIGRVPRTKGPNRMVGLFSEGHFPEGPLRWDRPRPDSTGSNFCRSCHTDNGRQASQTLSNLFALQAGATGTSMSQDSRRQSMHLQRMVLVTSPPATSMVNNRRYQPVHHRESHLIVGFPRPTRIALKIRRNHPVLRFPVAQILAREIVFDAIQKQTILWPVFSDKTVRLCRRTAT